jgi:O-antigen/teichoic acid export membrane protein
MSIYTLCNVINASIPFILLPILSRHLSTDEYGVYSIYILLVNGLVPFTGLQISRSIVRNYIDQEIIDISVYTFSCLVASTISTLITLLIVISFSSFFSKLFLFPEYWLWAPIIASYGQTYLAVSLGLLQMSDRPLAYGLVRISHSLLLSLLTIYLVLQLNWKAEGPIFGHAISMLTLVPLILFIFAYTDFIKLKLSVAYIIDALKYGLPLVPHVIGTVLVTMIDRIFISHYIGMDAVGVYAAGYQISLILFIIITSFNQVWTPWLFPKLKEGTYENRRQIVKIIYLFFAILVLCAFLFSLISFPFIQFYLDESYFDSSMVIPWLLASFVFHGMYIVMGSFLYFSKKTGLLSLATIITALVNILFNFILVPIFGVIGAAQASIISFLFGFLLTWYFASLCVKLPWVSFYKTDAI